MSQELPVRFSPEELASLLGESHAPTAEQSAIISAPLEPMLVIAGAGSGKTATMSDRVVWLVANGWVRPEEILGVTFTRKAAGELASRIRSKLAALAKIAAADTKHAVFPAGLLDPDALEPKVSTYHSYASSIVSDHGLRLGIERDVTLLGGARMWQMANEIVESFDGEYEHLSAAKSTLVKAVVQLSGECSEHLRPATEVQEWLAERLATYSELPLVSKGARGPEKAAKDLERLLKTRITVAELVERYEQAKRRRSVLDFGDLVELAARISNEIPEAARMERERSKVVLLDEFQDTSHAQMVLFSRLFGDGHPVTAVGDPNQSIYGFRGASAGQLFHFSTEFPRVFPDGNRAPAKTAFLTTAWRNGHNVLAMANTIAAPLNKAAVSVTGGVPSLTASPTAKQGRVVMSRFNTDVDESLAITEAIMRLRRPGGLREPGVAGGRSGPPIMAVLCRRRAQMEGIRQQFERYGVPYEIVGLGGLMDTPEIVDMVATLHVLADPGRSDSLMRLLAGARWRLGTADLMAFNDWSRFLAKRRAQAIERRESLDLNTPEELESEDASAPVIAADLSDSASLIEALDWLPQPGWVSGHQRSLTAEGLERLQRLSAELRTLRTFLGDDLISLLGEVERTMLLDIEVAAKPGVSIHQARRNLDAFQDAAAGFMQTAERVDLATFLAWLEAAQDEENGLAMAQAEVNPEAVQLLTVHASKGLEWDAVFVPGLNAGSFPSDKISRWSSGSAALPWPLRGDANDLPQWDTDQPDKKGWLESEKTFSDEVGAHAELEERRLAYVAYTRAKDFLWLSSAAWVGTRSKPSEPSPFLSELWQLAVPGQSLIEIHAESVEAEAITETNPHTAEIQSANWPYDPLEGPLDAVTGERLSLKPGRRAAMERAAVEVNAWLERGTETGDIAAGLSLKASGWAEEAKLLLAAREQLRPNNEVRLPQHISASTLTELRKDPVGVVTQLRRPIPRQPGMAARKGTAFHLWVEEFFGSAGMLDFEDLAGTNSDPADVYQLEELVETFKRSEWASRIPAFVEAAVETRVGDVVVRGRIDAIFQDADGGWELVDWKTGHKPSAKDLEVRAVQLAVYRLAWARLKNVPLAKVRAAFYYVADDAVVRPMDLAEEAELEAIVAAAYAEQPV
ncbi:ATP-dependent helicase [Pseudarthrobacter sp. J1738]|uniref:ATP-dependent helicase n=1 Tax=Pseudarthrobacter sp. J1738 TaxID=3420446 RepID=UPI003D2B2E95